MAQFRKLKPAQMEVGEMYVVYSARNKMLSSNGDRGRIVKLVSKTADDVTVSLLGTSTTTNIRKLSEREDAWAYSPAGVELMVRVFKEDPSEGPAFSPRMITEGFETKAFPLKPEEFYCHNREGEAYCGIEMVRHEGETTNPTTGQKYKNVFRLSWLIPAESPEWRVPRAERMGLGAIELPLPKKPVPPEQAADIEALIPVFEELLSSFEGGNNVSFAKIGSKLNVSSWHKNQACHAAMQNESRGKIKYIATIGRNPDDKSRWVKGRASEERELEYINYLANHSPYADAIVTKDPEFIRQYGYVIDASAPSRIVVGACFATRQLWEKPFRVEAFTELMLKGVTPRAAFMFACQCSEFKNGKAKLTMGAGDHNNFQSSQVSDKCMINFMKGTPERKGKPYNEEAQTFGEGGVDGMWSKSYGGKRTKVYEQLASIKGNSSNPMLNSLPVDDVFEKAADIIDDWLGLHSLA